MKNTKERRDYAAIAQTRSILAGLKQQSPSELHRYVIGLALTYDDPLNFWGEYCDVGFLEANIMPLQREDLLAFYEQHSREINVIKERYLRSPHGMLTYDEEFLARFAIENTAFHLRQSLPD